MEWFENWFETPYYHILYQNRNSLEAAEFIKNLIGEIKLPEGKKVLDLACGKGRHSVTLAKLGFDVTGIDLSKNSIEHARRFETDKLTFQIHDMRKPLDERFDAVFNFFTSFGYFENLDDNLKVLQSVEQMLDSDGVFVLDYLNGHFVKSNLVLTENKNLNGVTFHISREIENGFIVKTIRVDDVHKNVNRVYTEKVADFSLEDLERLTEKAGLKITALYGDYELKPYDKNTSSRLILVCAKATVN